MSPAGAAEAKNEKCEKCRFYYVFRRSPTLTRDIGISK